MPLVGKPSTPITKNTSIENHHAHIAKYGHFFDIYFSLFTVNIF